MVRMDRKDNSLKADVVTGPLLAVWPILSFVAHNKDERLGLWSPLVVALSACAMTVLIALLLRLLPRGFRPGTTLPVAGVAVASFFSYGVLRELLPTDLAASYTVSIWLTGWVAVIILAAAGLRKRSVRQAVGVAAAVATLLPLANLAYYAAVNRERIFGGTANVPSPTRSIGPDVSVDRSPVLRTFRNLNYQVLFANLAGTPTDACNPYCIGGQRHLTFEQIELYGMTPLLDLVRAVQPRIWRNWTTSYQKNPLDVVKQIPDDVPEPFFLFAHILSPHPPYIYESNCSIRGEFLLKLDPSISLTRSDRDLQERYVEQLACVNTLMQQAVEEILRTDPTALIVIQGDHGLGKLESRFAEEDQVRSRYGILNAFRLSKACEPYVYDSITSVNTFRLVFACLNHSLPQFVPDRMFGYPTGRAAPELPPFD